MRKLWVAIVTNEHGVQRKLASGSDHPAIAAQYFENEARAMGGQVQSMWAEYQTKAPRVRKSRRNHYRGV